MKRKVKTLKKPPPFDRDYLRRCKYSSPESKLNWLAGALELARTKKEIIRKK